MADWDELLGEARDRLEELEAGTGDGALGEAVTLGENEHFQGRWRGEGTLQTRNGTRGVYLVWHPDGSLGLLFQHSRLVQEIDEVQPAIGDDVLVLRGADLMWETRDGDERTVFTYSVVARPSDDPLPGSGKPVPAGSPPGPGGSFDDDIPFAPAA
jgi:hypothetical protein